MRLVVAVGSLSVRPWRAGHVLLCGAVSCPGSSWFCVFCFGGGNICELVLVILSSYVCDLSVCMHLCATCVPGARGGRVRVLTSLRLGLEGVSCQAGLTLGPLEEHLALLTAEPALQPSSVYF